MSFWSNLAGIGASLIPGVGAIAGPLVGGLLGGIGGGGKTNPAADPLNNPQVQALLKGLQTPATTDPATSQASGYYRTILNGGQDATTSLMGPEVSTVLGQFDNASKAAAELGPRGGGRAAIQAETPFKKTGAYVDLLGKAKQGAAQGLAGIGCQQTAAQTARRGQDVSTLGSILGGRTSLAEQQNQFNQENASGLGKGIGGLLTNVLSGTKFGKGKSGGGGTPVGGDYTAGNWGY